MKAIQHPSNNDVLGAPPGVERSLCGALPITRVKYGPSGLDACWSYWMPDDAERALLAAGKPVRISIWGRTHPPVAIGVDGDGL